MLPVDRGGEVDEAVAVVVTEHGPGHSRHGQGQSDLVQRDGGPQAEPLACRET